MGLVGAAVEYVVYERVGNLSRIWPVRELVVDLSQDQDKWE